MALKDNDIKFFRPLWIRVTVTGVVVAWFLFETIFSHETMWMTITGIGIVYCVWNFFLRFPKQDAGQPPDGPSTTPPPGPTQP
jgi:hypothetical protein